MRKTRRDFLVAIGSIGSSVGLIGAISPPQAQNQNPPAPPPPQKPTLPGDEQPSPSLSPKIFLKDNDKDIKKNIEKLYQLVSELKSQIEKTDSSQILSLGLVRKAEEIEKLAREIKTRAKG